MAEAPMSEHESLLHAFDLLVAAVEGKHDFPSGTRFIATEMPWFRGDLNAWSDKPTVFVNPDGSWLYWNAA